MSSSSSTAESAPAATNMAPSPTSPTFVRRPYHGSCHCQSVKYIVWIHLPAPPFSSAESLSSEQPVPPFADTDFSKFLAATGQEIYKCNCTTCHKLGHFHLRLKDSPRDFVLLTTPPPRTGVEPGQPGGGGGMTSYVIPGGATRWCFCERCGAEVFGIKGEFERVEGVKVPERVVGEMGLESERDGGGAESTGAERVVSGWSPKSEGWEEDGGEGGPSSYFSLNLISVDAGQEGFDLREIQERGWVQYVDGFYDTPGSRTTRPYEHGMY